MAEKLLHTPESNDADKELISKAHEQREHIRETTELKAESAPERSAEKAREKVEAIVENQEKEAKAEKDAKLEKPPLEHKKTPTRNKKSLDASFKSQMKDTRDHMPIVNRAFSKVIHTKVVEKSSEAIGATIARPNALLAGSFTALVLTAGLYFWAKNVGYPLSGFETIGAFIIGWIIGITIDFTRIMISGKN